MLARACACAMCADLRIVAGEQKGPSDGGRSGVDAGEDQRRKRAGHFLVTATPQHKKEKAPVSETAINGCNHIPVQTGTHININTHTYTHIHTYTIGMHACLHCAPQRKKSNNKSQPGVLLNRTLHINTNTHARTPLTHVHTRTCARTHARTHARTQTHARAHAHALTAHLKALSRYSGTSSRVLRMACSSELVAVLAVDCAIASFSVLISERVMVNSFLPCRMHTMKHELLLRMHTMKHE